MLHVSFKQALHCCNIHHNWVSKTTRKNEKYLMMLARTPPYFIILMVRKHCSALGVQMCPVNFCRDRAKNINNTEGERVLTVTAAGRVLCSEKYIFYAASSYFVGQIERRRKCHNFCTHLSREQGLEISHSVHLRLGLPPDLHEQLHLVLLAASSPSSCRSWCSWCSSPAVNVQDVFWEAQSDGQWAPFSDNLKQWRQLS